MEEKKGSVETLIGELLAHLGKERAIMIPESVIENLLTLEGMKNHSAVESVCQEIMRIAEDQSPTRFRSHRHGTR